MGEFVHPCRADQAWWIGSWPFLVWQTERQLLMYGKNKSGREWPTATTAPLFVFYGSVRPTLSLDFLAVHSALHFLVFEKIQMPKQRSTLQLYGQRHVRSLTGPPLE